MKRKNIYLGIGIGVFGLMLIMAILAPLLTKYSYSAIDLFNVNAKPGSGHLLGTDDLGRDVFTRILYGGRVSLIVGFIATLMQILIGVSLGLIAGYYGKWADFIIMRIIDILMCFPFFIVAISIAAVIGPSLKNLVIIIAILSWTEIARIVRAQTLSIKKMDFVRISKTIGFSDFKIILDNILPNVFPAIIVSATLSMATSILMEAALSFLGLGVKDPMPSWGNILNAAQNIRALQSYWWTWLPAGILIIVTVLAINLIGEGLRIYFNPIEEESKEEVETKIDFSLEPGTITALVGESGSGKTISSTELLGLNPSNIKIKGSVFFKGKDLLKRSTKEVESQRGREVAMIFQEPMKSLNPVIKLGKQVEEVFKIHTDMKKEERYEKTIELFKKVRLEDVEQVYHKYPHEISGGMRQRVQIAMAIAMKPSILIADEPTTAIDDSLKKSIMDLLKKLCKEEDMAMIFITHDLNRLENFADNIVVMYKGRVVEKNDDIKDFFKEPKHPYSKALLLSVPNKKTFDKRFYQMKGGDFVEYLGN